MSVVSGVISRQVLPVCGNLCFFCPAMRARSRQPVKRYKKMIADNFPKSQEEEPNDRKIGKLCEYAAKNPLRIPKIISTAEEYPMLKPPLYKMRHLIMKTALHINEYHGISFFLFSCPRLQTFTIHISSSTTIFPEREATLSLAEHEFLSNGYIMVYKCLKRTLKVVNVTGFKGHLNEMLAIQYFIKYGYALETLYINLSNEKGPDGIDMEASYRANAEFLSQIHRASNALNIFIN